jgi:hypothetical protein
MSFFLTRQVLHAVPAGTRAISRVGFDSGVYKRNFNIKKYIEFVITNECRKPGSLDAQGAVRAEMLYVFRATIADVEYADVEIPRGTCHHGGTNRNEPFHANFRFFDVNNKPMLQRCPFSGKKTDVYHFYLATDAQDLESSANAWAASI